MLMGFGACALWMCSSNLGYVARDGSISWVVQVMEIVAVCHGNGSFMICDLTSTAKMGGFKLHNKYTSFFSIIQSLGCNS